MSVFTHRKPSSEHPTPQSAGCVAGDAEETQSRPMKTQKILKRVIATTIA
jgi:hypothetical protein